MKQKKTPCICVICGKHFLGQNTKSKFCSQRCVYDDQNAKRRKNNNRPAEELIWLRKSEHKKIHQSIKAGTNNDGK